MRGEAKIALHEKHVLISFEGDSLAAGEIEFGLSRAIKEAIESDLSIIIHGEVPVKQRISIVDLYCCAEMLARSAFKNKLALAFPKEMHNDNLDFFETASRNRGINARLFPGMGEALKWIGDGINEHTA